MLPSFFLMRNWVKKNKLFEMATLKHEACEKQSCETERGKIKRT